MSIQIMTLVWKYSKLKGSALLLLLAIADNANTETKLAWPSMEYLAKKTRLSRRQVIRLISIIEQSGELEVLRSARFNRYRIHIDGDILSPSNKNDSDISEGVSDTQGMNGDTQGMNGDIAMALKSLTTLKETTIENQLITPKNNKITGFEEFEKILDFLKLGMGRREFSSYLGGASLVELQGGTLFIGVASKEKIDWLNARTKKQIERFVPGFGGTISSVEFIFKEG